MRKPSRKQLAIGVGAALVAASAAVTPIALAQPNSGVTPLNAPQHPDDLFGPLEADRRDARTQAIDGILSGKYSATTVNGSTVVDISGEASSGGTGNRGGGGNGGRGRGHGGGYGGGGNGHGGGGNGGGVHNTKPKYVELAREATDQVFVIPVQFGDELPDGFPTDPAAQRTEGPLHNEIPQPDRRVDNSTVWRADFNRAHYLDYYFGAGESLATYYDAQSSGRYTVTGDVTNWVSVAHSEAYYGTNDPEVDYEDESGDARAWLLIRDAADAWYASQLAAGKTDAQIASYLAQFDAWDRYDFDGDGDFNEPDGYIDHFQIVHAGGDEADGDPIYAGDALWSHRWQAFQDGNDGLGPWTLENSIYGPIGGAQLGSSPLWIYDYTLQPENGGRSVFFHEYGHDLGLPDDYNIYGYAGNTDNSNEHWTLMAQSRLGARNEQSIGDRAGDLSAWNKLQLGWLDYTYLPSTAHQTVVLGPEEYNSAYKQALIVGLPPKVVSTDIGAPYAGGGQYASGHANDSTLTLSKSVTVPADGQLTFKARYDIEYGWDYAQLTVDGTPVVGTVGGVETYLDDNYYGAEIGWDWISGSVDGDGNFIYGWVDASFDLSAYAGQTVDLAFSYVTDAAVGGNYSDLPDGLFLDDITLGGTVIGDAESGLDWTSNGWTAAGATSTAEFSNYYIASYRSYVSYDKYLETGPYFFGYADTKPDYVDHYPYQEGLLIAYWDLSQDDNDTVGHPGSGRNLNIDAHPAPLKQASGPNGYWRPRVQIYDAPFGLDKTDKVTLHVNSKKFTFGGLPANPTFKDTDKYWYAELPHHGVKLPAVGVTIKVLKDQGGKLTVKLN